LSPVERARLLELGAHEAHLADRYPVAVEWLQQEVELHHADGDALQEGDALRRLSWVARCGSQREVSDDACRRSVELLERQPAGPELARAYAHVAMLARNADDFEQAVSLGALAVEVAKAVGERGAHLHALNSVGTSQLLDGNPTGLDQLVRSLELAQELELEEDIGRAYIHLAEVAACNRDYALADRFIPGAVDYCTERGLDLWLRYVQVYRARVELDRGRWAEAAAAIPASVQDPGTPLPRIVALVTLGVLRARRNDPGQWDALDEASELAAASGELQWTAPVAAARAEARWLGGEPERVAEETEAALALATSLESARFVAELTSWRVRTGAGTVELRSTATPHALEAAGRWAEAAARWEELGCPYEAAIALVETDDDEALGRALEGLRALGAEAAVTIVARRLRARGARVARGPRAATRSNPAGLTARELDVLPLLAAGLRNREIGARLFLSPRTVDHHVAAILRKLGARTRGEAASEAVRLGLLADR